MEPSTPIGEAENFTLNITSVSLRSGTTLHLPKAGVTVIVGPNNVGKTTLIREISAQAKHGGRSVHVSPQHIVSDVEVQHTGSYDDVYAWILKHARLTQGGSGTFAWPGGRIEASELSRVFAENGGVIDGLQSASELLCYYGDAWQRLGGVGSAEKRDRYDAPADSPIHVLQDRPDLFEELNEICRQVFGLTLTLDALGRSLHLRIGETGLESPKVDEVTAEYWAAVSQLPLLTEQGDGMKSLLGLMLPLVTASYPIVFVDEPEAFLHPPQALALGRILGEQSRTKSTQIMLATHDRNIISGLLQSNAEVSIVRLDRGEEQEVRARQLNVDDLREVWGDPVLRYSNVLDGIFHKAVVLAEAERDCNFYASVLDEMDRVEDVLPGDVLFVPAGGKDGFPRLAKVLRSLHVPVVASPDLDLLNEKGKVKALVAAMGGNWSELDKFYDRATAEFRQPRGSVTIGNVMQALNSIFADRMGDAFTAHIRGQFMAQVRTGDNPWHALKIYGMPAFRADPRAADALLAGLQEVGIVAVRVGELERFAPTLGVAKGPAWLPAAIEAGAHRESAAREHVGALLKAASSSG